MLRTWHIEGSVVAVVLVTVALASGGGALELLGAAAVQLTFHHASVSQRLAEREAARDRPSVECHRWAGRYFIGKELLWCAYFILHGSWSALAGVGLFLVYPIWRRWWRQRYPLTKE